MATWLWTRSSWTMSTALPSPRTPHLTPPPPLPPRQPSETVTSRRISVTGVPWGRSSSGREARALRRAGQTGLARTGRDLKKVRLPVVSHDVMSPLCCVIVSGYFVLAKGRNGEDKMRTSLVSLPITTHSDTCFSFWFQMLVRSHIGNNISLTCPPSLAEELRSDDAAGDD